MPTCSRNIIIEILYIQDIFLYYELSWSYISIHKIRPDMNIDHNIKRLRCIANRICHEPVQESLSSFELSGLFG
nr:MAG TPA: hypothetical protein [Bacteriophage sp.]